MDAEASHRPVVLAPTYNNAGTIAQVLEQIDRIGLDVLVVNDGSTDRTADILDGWSRATGPAKHLTILHPVNRGKAAALLTGFEHARSIGYTHAITIDTDGQLDPGEIPLLLEQSRKQPAAMIVGCRDA